MVLNVATDEEFLAIKMGILWDPIVALHEFVINVKGVDDAEYQYYLRHHPEGHEFPFGRAFLYITVCYTRVYKHSTRYINGYYVSSLPQPLDVYRVPDNFWHKVVKGDITRPEFDSNGLVQNWI